MQKWISKMWKRFLGKIEKKEGIFKQKANEENKIWLTAYTSEYNSICIWISYPLSCKQSHLFVATNKNNSGLV